MKGRCRVPFGDSGRALSEEDRMGGSALDQAIESVTPHWAPSISSS